jgi:large subunit ribosomal protein L18
MKRADQRINRHRKIRTKISGTADRPRLVVYKSNRFFTAQLIDDAKGITIVSAGDLKVRKGTKTARAEDVGKSIAKLAGDLPAGRQGKKIKEVVFDRAGFLYAGRVKAFADAARAGGLKF